MIRRSKAKSVVDLTPLLDVVLILLFALLMNMSFEQDSYKAEASELDQQLEQANEDKEALNQLIEQQEAEMSKLESNLEQLDEQSQVIDEAIVTWFASEEIRDRELVTSEDFEQIFDKETTNQSLYQMDFIANQFFFIDIEFDTEQLHQVIINGVSTNVQLTADKRGNQEELKLAYDEIYDFIDSELVNRDGGYSFALFTLKDNGGVYKYAYDLVWGILKDIEDNNLEKRIYKLQYLDY